MCHNCGTKTRRIYNMTKTKLYIYPQAKPHEHDTNSAGMSQHLKNTVPLSQKGIREHCIVTSPDAADYFYMGQFALDTGEILKCRGVTVDSDIIDFYDCIHIVETLPNDWVYPPQAPEEIIQPD